NATGVSTATAVSIAFSEPIQPSTLVFTLKTASGVSEPSSVTYDPTSRTATLAVDVALLASSTYTVTAAGAKDLAGNTMTPVTWSCPPSQAITTATIGGSGAPPAVESASDSGQVELGVKFRSDIGGYVTGVRFYKGAGNTGTHVGHLWTSAGTLLAAATFTGE